MIFMRKQGQKMTEQIVTLGDITTQLQAVSAEIVASVRAMTDEAFVTGTETAWAPADYLKHLILRNKPFAKALTIPHAQLKELFGVKDMPHSMTFSEVVTLYGARIAQGLTAQVNPAGLPTSYRVPEGMTDIRTYLLETWIDSSQRLETALAAWSENDLDSYRLPHPAMNLITVREMCYFTVHHNRIHAGDIAAGKRA